MSDDDVKKIFEQAQARPTPEPGRRVRFPEISSRTWEHPADRAALAALRKVPGLDALLKRVFGFISERSLRLLYLANAVEVSARQFKRINALYDECCEVLDVTKRPTLFVAQHPVVNAGAIGIDDPFIVLYSGALELMDDEEIRFIIGHELGHVMSGHALYKTMLHLLLQAVAGRAGLSSLVISAIVMALREWDRKSELSSDRAGLLCLQNPTLAYRVQMKMAGGGRVDEMDVDAFVAQAEQYEKGGDLRDGALRFLNLLGRTHPFAVLRLAELKRWVDGGHYAAVLGGQYVRRSDPTPMYDDVTASVQSYRDGFSESEDPLFKAMRDLGSTVSDGSRALMDQLRDLFGGRRAAKDGKEPKDGKDGKDPKDDGDDPGEV